MDWEKVKLGDIATCIQPGPFGSQLHRSDYSDEGTPIVMPKDMINGHISHQNLIYVGDEHVKRLTRHQVHDGDIMVARKGDVRKCVYITENEDGWMTGSDCLKVSLDKDRCIPKFVFYQLRSSYIGRWLETISIGATMPSINTGLLSSIELYFPPLPTQHRIASALSTYDDLIENNRKQIKLLEEAAQRIYKQWFVDFRFPGHENARIIDGVPEGWKKVAIDDFFSIKYGKTLPTSKISSTGKYPVYGANGIIGYYTEKNIDEYVVLITSRGNGSGDVLRTYDKEAFVTNNSFIVKPLKEYIGFAYTYQLMKNTDFKTICTGSAQPQLTNNSISTLNILLPTKKMIEDFDSVTEILYRKLEVLNYQIRSATEARDRLLPKLMSGEIEVSL